MKFNERTHEKARIAWNWVWILYFVSGFIQLSNSRLLSELAPLFPGSQEKGISKFIVWNSVLFICTCLISYIIARFIIWKCIMRKILPRSLQEFEKRIKFQHHIEHNDIEDERLIIYLDRKKQFDTPKRSTTSALPIRQSTLNSGRKSSRASNYSLSSINSSGYNILNELIEGRLKVYNEAERTEVYKNSTKFDSVAHYDIRVRIAILIF